jgi:hypothetical protein
MDTVPEDEKERQIVELAKEGKTIRSIAKEERKSSRDVIEIL